MSQPRMTEEWTGKKTIEKYLSGKTLKEEIWMPLGSCALESVSQNYAQVREQNEKLTAISSPKQLLIDKVLARRRFDQLVKEEEHRARSRKLKEKQESLKQELHKLQSQKKHLGTEFTIPSCTHDDQSALQFRILQIRNNLPTLENRIQELRKEYFRNREKMLTSYNKDSIFQGAEPYHIRHINMVHSMLNDMIENLLDDYTRKTPDKMNTFTADQFSWKTSDEADNVLKEVMMDRVANLIVEQFVLEITRELSSEVAQEFFIVNQMSRSLAFDVIFNAVQEVGKERQKESQNEKPTASVDHLTTWLLEQQNDRELHRKGLWGHILSVPATEIPSDVHLQQERI
ncbi:uncharacterized protein [Chiloscyllium punctatum]|uniref:Uncharacterized protein n=1 Tax=Chiloscyllium punctatum TaxID=137246 RepID=A0A401S2N3_CHIPU|nr:hypothetical protein [Chiloscyllium punctatum]